MGLGTKNHNLLYYNSSFGITFKTPINFFLGTESYSVDFDLFFIATDHLVVPPTNQPGRVTM